MIKAVVDTNVFISGTIWKGSPHKVLAHWAAAKFKLVVSHEIVNEYETIRMHSEYVQPMKLPKPIC
jgi:putative PIN family toxin of toxin-antitoxin system